MAIQIPGSIDGLPQDIRPIVKNRNPDYAREHSADDDLAVAVVNAKDVAIAEDLEDDGASCWIKMSEVSIEGLRQAFLDPGSRIRLNPRESEEHAELVALGWTGGFLDGASIRFNPNLNVLVGGRGTGKSTVIESIRAVLGLDPIGDDARSAHEGIVRHVLRSGTKISLRVRVCRPAPREYVIERTVPNPPLVRDESGDVSTLSPAAVLQGIEVYGQHEISELTKSREKLTRLLDRFVEHVESNPRHRSDLVRNLEQNRRGLLDAREALEGIEERLAALPGLEETLVRFREAGLEDRLKEKSLLVEEEQLLGSVPDRLDPLRQCIETLSRVVPIDRSFVSEEALEALPGRATLGQINELLEELEGAIRKALEDLTGALEQTHVRMEAVRSTWSGRKQVVEDDYQRILRELQETRIDGEEFIRLQRHIQELRPLRERSSLLQRNERELVDRRRTLLADWEDLKADEFRRLDRAARRVNRKLRDRVQVAVTASGDREALYELLRNGVGGRLSEAIDKLEGQAELSLASLVNACREGAGALRRVYDIPPGQAASLAGASEDVLFQIEELRLPATTSISLNTAPAGEPPNWQDLGDLSTGQKATAVLLLLLLDSEAPLIVDQPEDDLDNRFITEGVVPRMREEKQRRQFIFSTHNANIPVLGDAELIVGLSASGEADHGQARMTPDQMGSIDSGPVRELVEEILEGGKDAFERRRRKYGF